LTAPRQAIKKCPGLPEIRRVEALGEPAIDRDKEICTFLPFAALGEEPR